MTSVQETREKQIRELDDFIENSKQKLSMILSRLGWTEENITKNVENVVVCPFDESHHVMEKSLDKHLEDCQWKAEGYRKKDLPLSIPSLPIGAPSSIKFDEQLQDEVIQNAAAKNPSMMLGTGGRLIPRTSDRLTSDFTRDEKSAIYEHVIANTVEPDMGADIADMNKPKSSSEGKTSSYLELLAQERNLKRRRAKYRGVHTNKKSQVEILREVVNQQMEMLVEYISENQTGSSNFSFDHSSNKRKLNDVDFGDENIEKTAGNFSRTENESFRAHQSFSNDNTSRHHSRKEQDPHPHGKEESREFYRRENENERERSRKKEKRRERENSRDSGEKKSHKSSHKKHKHKSKDYRSRSRDREKKSRSSHESKHEKRKSESSRHSRHDRKRSKRDYS